MSVPITILSPSLIGRTSEVAALREALAEARAGSGQVIFLAGESGIGKSRLAREATSDAMQQGMSAIAGACFEEDRSFPYAPWVDALRSFLDRPEAAAFRGSLAGLAPELARLLPELRWSNPDLAPAEPLDPEAEKRRLFEAVVQFLTRIAQAGSLLLVLEDLHWSDESSVELLRFFARRIANQKILVVATYRAEEVSPHLARYLVELNRQHVAREINLAPLSPNETSALVQAILDLRQPLRPDFLESIAALTEGNPFYVEEVLKSLVEAGDFALAEGGWGWRHSEALPVISRSVRELVNRRVERLGAEARQLLALCAVIGQRADLKIVTQVMATPEADLLEGVRQLVSAQLLVEASADELVFRHALTRQAVYTSLLARERRMLHRQVLPAVELRYAQSPQEGSAELAYHAYGAEEWAKALAYSQAAGGHAQALYAPRESLAHYSRALEAARRLALDPPLELLSARARAYEYLGEFDAARSDYERVLNEARSAGNRPAEWQALLDLGTLWTQRDYALSGRYLEEALALAYTLETPASVAHSMNWLGNWHFNQMRLAEALRYHGEALEIFRGLGDRQGVAETLDMLGTPAFVRGDIVSGVSYLNEAIALFRELGNKRRLAQCLVTLPLAYRFNTEILGDIDPAGLAAAGEAGLQMAREMGWRAGELQAYGRQSLYGREAGEYGSAFATAANALALAEEIGHVGFLATASWGMGELYLDVFNPAQAAPYVERAGALARESGSAIWQHHASMALGRLGIMRHDWAGVEAALGEPRSPLPGPGLPTQARETWALRAEARLAKHDAAGTLAILDRLIATSVNVDRYGPHAIPRLSLLRGQALSALGRHAEAEKELQATWGVALAQGKRSYLWRIAASQGRAARGQDHRSDADRAFATARGLIAELASGIPDPELRRSFMQGAEAGIPQPRPLTAPRVARQEYDGLTAREREVAALVCRGRSNREIGEALVISERTVDRHLANIMAKLGFTSRAQVAAWAVEKGLKRG